MNEYSLLALAAGATLITIGCGGGNSASTPPPTSQVSVSIAPTSADLQVGGTKQFKATVTGSTDTSVLWSISASSSPPSADIGSIDSAGRYVAPQWITSQLTINVLVTSNADPSKSASAVVTVSVPTQPVLLWKDAPAGTTLTTALATWDGHVLTGGYRPTATDPHKFIATVLEYGPLGNQTGRFDDDTESQVLPHTAVTDGVVMYFGGQKGSPQSPSPMLLAFYANLDKKYEVACNLQGSMTGLAESPTSTLYFGDQADPNSLALGTADPGSGNIDCQTNFIILNAGGARLSGLSAVGDHISVSGHYPVQGGCRSNNGYTGQFSLQAQRLWMYEFNRDSAIAPNSVLSPALLETNEGGRSFIYVSGSWLACQGTQQFFTAKFDQNGHKVWQRLWDGGNTQSQTVSGVAAVMPWPSGNIAVVGYLTQLSPSDGHANTTDCGLVVYKPDGTQVFTARQNEFKGADIACEGATISPDKHFLFEVGQIKQQSMMVVKYALPPQ